MNGWFFLGLVQIGGMWSPVITFLEVLVGAATTLGIMIGALMVASSPHSDERRVVGWKLITGAMAGGLLGFSAVPIYNFLEGTLW